MNIKPQIKNDLKKLGRAYKYAVIDALKKAGAYYRTSIQRSMKWVTKNKRYKPSKPGEPPKAIRGKGQLRKFIIYEVDEKTYKVEIGAKKLGTGFVPVLLEKGGTERKKHVRVGSRGAIAKRNGKDVVIKIKTEAQAKRAAANARPSVYAPRPYISSTVERVGPQVKKLFFDTFTQKLEKKLSTTP